MRSKKFFYREDAKARGERGDKELAVDDHLWRLLESIQRITQRIIGEEAKEKVSHKATKGHKGGLFGLRPHVFSPRRRKGAKTQGGRRVVGGCRGDHLWLLLKNALQITQRKIGEGANQKLSHKAARAERGSHSASWVFTA